MPIPRYRYSAVQILQCLREAGYDGGLTIVKDYVRQVRPVRAPAFLTLHQRTWSLGAEAAWSAAPDGRGLSAWIGSEVRADVDAALDARLGYGLRGFTWSGVVTPYVSASEAGRQAVGFRTFESERTFLGVEAHRGAGAGTAGAKVVLELRH